MRIVLCSRLSGHGGVAVYNRTLARALSDDGHDVTIVTSDASLAARLRQTEQDGIATVYIPTEIPRHWRLPGLRYYARSWNHRRYSRSLDGWLSSLPQAEKPDVVEFAEVGGEGFFFTRRLDRPAVVVRCHTPTFILRKHHVGGEMKFDTGIVERMEKACIRGADLLTTPSVDMAEVVSSETGVPLDRFHPVANAVDVNLPDPADLRVGQSQVPEGAVVVLHVGRLERIKGIGVLADAIPRVLRACPNAFFVFIGQPRAAEDGQMWDRKLHDFFEHASVSSRVRLLNYVDTPVMNGWYRRADLAVVPSLNYESFSYTCAQAMAAGLPVVATAIGGMPETLGRGSCGILYDPPESKPLTDALVALIRDGTLRRKMGSRGRERANACFAAPVVARRMVELYEKAIRSRS
ncbi:MAG: glycosyltransferase family 4 protein [Opitutaceae bacterium]